MAATYRSGDVPDGVLGVECDVTDPGQVEAAFAQVEADLGPVEVVVANAGITRDTLVMRMSDDDWDAVLATNLTGAFRVARRAARPMIRARFGRIVFISSVVGQLGSAGQVNYAASKAGLVGLARSLARELGSRGVTANVVAPGFIETDMTAELGEDLQGQVRRADPAGPDGHGRRHRGDDRVPGQRRGRLHHRCRDPGRRRPRHGALMGILDGKNILVAGVTLDTSIGFHVARVAQAEGATVVVSNFGRAMSLTGRVIKKLDPVPPLLEVDVTNDEHLAGLADQLGEHVDRLDGLVHSLAFANPETALGGKFLTTPWADVSTALQVSAYSLASLTMACRPLLEPAPRWSGSPSTPGSPGRSTTGWASPRRPWRAPAATSPAISVRRASGCNLVAAGPLETLAKKAIGGAEEFNEVWGTRAPIGWDPKDMTPTAKAVVALLSDFFPKTTGEMIHVDGGLHSTGA